MANEIYTGGGSGANLVQASRLSELFLETIADRDYSVLAHPAIMYLGDINGGQSSATLIPVVNVSDDEFASLTEIQAGTPSDIASAQAPITVGRWYLERDYSDFISILDGTGAVDEVALVDGMIIGANMTTLSLVVTVGATFTVIKGASGATLTHATILEAKQALRSAHVKGPYVCILGAKQFNEWETDFNSLGGAVQFKTEQASEMARLTGNSYMGSWDGIDFYTSSKVITDGTDLNGCMFGLGAIGWKSAHQTPSPAQVVVVDAGFVQVEASREGNQALSKLQGNMWIGVGKLQDAGGVRIRSVD